MINSKEIGNSYEQHICQVISEMLGIKFKPTQRSGGSLHAGDIREYTASTPLAKYCIEIKYHETQKSFNKDFRTDLQQARIQTPTNKNWMLITKLPNTDIDIIIMDLQDYLINDVMGQMLMNKTQLKNLLNDCNNAFQDLRENFETFREHLKKEY